MLKCISSGRKDTLASTSQLNEVYSIGSLRETWLVTIFANVMLLASSMYVREYVKNILKTTFLLMVHELVLSFHLDSDIFKLHIELTKLVSSFHLSSDTFKLHIKLTKLDSNSHSGPRLPVLLNFTFSSLNLSQVLIMILINLYYSTHHTALHRPALLLGNPCRACPTRNPSRAFSIVVLHPLDSLLLHLIVEPALASWQSYST